jgi:pimeloyl-ACP methyl ester carboxylesterase
VCSVTGRKGRSHNAPRPFLFRPLASRPRTSCKTNSAQLQAIYTTSGSNITLYWLTGTGASAARSYWENGRAAALAAGQVPPEVSLPVSYTTLPGEIFRALRSWVEKAYPNLIIYFNEVDRGGHFAAWEEPELFATEMRAALTSLR